MDKLNYKKFIDLSKYVVDYNKLNKLQRIVFNLEAPFRYKKFKKNYDNEMKSKIEKKEVK